MLRPLFYSSLAMGLCALMGCAQEANAVIENRRVANKPSGAVMIGATSDQRFGAAKRAEESSSRGPGVVYQLPTGWKELPAQSPRLFSLAVAGRDDCNASLVMLPGSGGGLVANIERWQDQMAGSDGARAEVVERREVLMLRGQATLVVIDGHYRGMGEADLEDARMVGVILLTAKFTIFAKMTGPRALVESETGAFEAWCASLDLAQEPQSKPAASLPPAGAGAFIWDAPDGWRDLGARSMRLASFEVAEGCECSISTAGGSPEANAERWLGQMGADALGPDGFLALERMSTGLGEAILVQADGTWTSMSGTTIEGARLLGAIVPMPRTNIFIKLWGPVDGVAGATEAFKGLTKSLRMKDGR
jgi:hypothetical protein